MGVLPQAFEIVFEGQMKRGTEKIARRKISFSNHKTCCFFLVFGPLLLSKLLTFSFLVQFKQFNVIYERHLQFYKLSLNSNSNRATYKECLGDWAF
jgi:hypothetical protein